MKAAYRFFDNEKVTFEKVLEPHIAKTKERMAATEGCIVGAGHDRGRPDTAGTGGGGCRGIGWTASGSFAARDARVHTGGAASGHCVGRGVESNRGGLA